MSSSVKPPNESYLPVGGARDLMLYKGTEVLIGGPAGTGKSLACLVKLHAWCDNVPNVRCLIVRKTRESLTEAALVTYENHVLHHGHPALATGGQRRMRQSYQYPNGSVIVVGGLDKSQKVMSTEYDLIYIQEAIEVEETDWENLITRLRNNKIPYQQILADTNPDSPTHWLKKRCDVGTTYMIESRHEDNPVLFNRHTKTWTKLGEEYIAKLDNLTGARKQRLRYGKWVQSEGVVYEGWDRRTHLIDRIIIPREWNRYLSVDFGYTNPFVCQWWAEDDDGRLYMYRELYQTRRLVEEHAEEIKIHLDDEPTPKAIICDHDAEDRATLEKHLGLPTRKARKTITDGIQAVSERLKVQGDGKPRLYVFRDALINRDPWLEENKKPCGLAEEIDGYVWNTKEPRPKDDQPIKLNDHSCDSMRYVVAHLDSRIKYKEIITVRPIKTTKKTELPVMVCPESEAESYLTESDISWLMVHISNPGDAELPGREFGAVDTLALHFTDDTPEMLPLEWEQARHQAANKQIGKKLWAWLKRDRGNPGLGVLFVDDNEKRGASVAAGILSGLNQSCEWTDIIPYIRDVIRDGKALVL